MEKEIIKKILEFIKESESIMVILRAEAIDQTQNWKKYPAKREAADKRINKLSKISEELETSLTNLNLEKESIVSVEDYNKLLASQKPDNLPTDWETQLADKKQLEIKLNAVQTDLSNEQQARQQAENKIQQAEQFGLTDWDNLANQTGGETLASILDRAEKEAAFLKKLKGTLNNSFPDLIGSENKVNEEVLKKSLKQPQQQLPKVDEESGVIEKLNALIDKIKKETTPQKQDQVKIRVLVEKVEKDLEKIVGELQQKKVDLKNLSEEYQNQQIQPPKK